jgi:hypothetical protein
VIVLLLLVLTVWITVDWWVIPFIETIGVRSDR